MSKFFIRLDANGDQKQHDTDDNFGTIGNLTISSAVLTTADINGGTMDGVTIATSDVTVGAGKTLDVSAGTFTLADNQISGDKVEGGTIAEITIAAATITQLAAAMDANNQAITNIDINSGAIDGVTIATSDITVGAGKTLTVSAGTLTTSAAQNLAIMQGAGADVDIGAFDLRAATLTADLLTAGRVLFAGTDGVLSDDADMSFSVDTLTVAKLGAFTAAGAIDFASQAMTSVDINSGAIDNTPIGASSASTGAFSTLAASGAATMSSTLGVTGASTLSSTLAVTGAATMSSTLAVTGIATFSDQLLPGTDSAKDIGGSAAVEAFEAEQTSGSSKDLEITWGNSKSSYTASSFVTGNHSSGSDESITTTKVSNTVWRVQFASAISYESDGSDYVLNLKAPAGTSAYIRLEYYGTPGFTTDADTLEIDGTDYTISSSSYTDGASSDVWEVTLSSALTVPDYFTGVKLKKSGETDITGVSATAWADNTFNSGTAVSGATTLSFSSYSDEGKLYQEAGAASYKFFRDLYVGEALRLKKMSAAPSIKEAGTDSMLFTIDVGTEPELHWHGADETSALQLTSNNKIHAGALELAGTSGLEDSSGLKLEAAQTLIASISGVSNNLSLGSSLGIVTVQNDLTVDGDLIVSGDTVTVNTATLSVEDPLIVLANGNNASDVVDIGLYGLYDSSSSQDLYGGLFRDASDSGKWKLFKDNQAEPTTTVNTGGTGYAVGTLVANLEGSVTGDVTGDLTGNADTAAALQTARTIALAGDVVGSVSFNGTGNVSIATVIQANSVALSTDTTGNYVAIGAVSGVGLSGSSSSEGGTFTINSNATDANTASTLVARDASGDFTAGIITAALVGNASTATTLQTAHTIAMSGDVVWSSGSFDGSADVTDAATIQSGVVTSDMIADDSIVNADINASAAIVDTKLAQISTAGKVALSALEIDGETSAVTALVDADLFIVDDGAGGTNSKMVASVLGAYAQSKISVTDAGGDGSLAYNSSTGVITYTGPSAAEVRAHVSVTDSGGDGSLAYSSATGVLTYTGPSAAEVRTHFSGGTGVSYSSGVISIGQAVATDSNVEFGQVKAEGFGLSGMTAKSTLGTSQVCFLNASGELEEVKADDGDARKVIGVWDGVKLVTHGLVTVSCDAGIVKGDPLYLIGTDGMVGDALDHTSASNDGKIHIRVGFALTDVSSSTCSMLINIGHPTAI
jgi:hypothetical protein